MLARWNAATKLAHALVHDVSGSIVTGVRIRSGSIWRIVRDQTTPAKQTSSNEKDADGARLHWTNGMHVADTLMYELFLLRVQFVPELSSHM